MFRKGARVNTPMGFGRVISKDIKDEVRYYSVELEKDSTRSIYPASEISLSQESTALVREYLQEMAKIDGEWNQNDDEITKNTCPACAGAGSFEQRVETATTYVCTKEVCFLCNGNQVVGADAYAKYARMISKLV